MSRHLPEDFILGLATSAFQIEGGVGHDGRGASIWDEHTDASGVGHVQHLDEDLDLIDSLGAEAYRFSISWPRVQPTGTGAANPAGLDFYDRLVDGLLARGVAPTATLYHWDLPAALETTGGWAERDTASAFADYTAIVAARLGDRVTTWTTINEPWCVAFLGYAAGLHAPKRTDPEAALKAAHHLNLAHGLAVDVLRSSTQNRPDVSISLNLHVLRPHGPDDQDQVERLERVANQIFTGPLLGDGYSPELIADTAEVTAWEFVEAGDEAVTRAEIDVLGLNYYSPHTVRRRSPGEPSSALGQPWPGSPDLTVDYPPGPRTGLGWTVDPTGLGELLRRSADEHPRLPLLVTENGASFGLGLNDPARVAYLRDHLAAVLDAQAQGVDVRGYYVWSLLDNVEWTLGRGPRFGLFEVDDETFERRPRESARWFADLADRRILD